MIVQTFYDDSGFPLGDIHMVDKNNFYVYLYKDDREYFGFKSEEQAGDWIYDQEYDLK